jgi:hypothetical protein
VVINREVVSATAVGSMTDDGFDDLLCESCQ